jgi:O-antigen/teichoic acid export membrane protein
VIEATPAVPVEVSPPAGGVFALLRSGAVISAAVGATFVLNGLFNLVMARHIEPREYSLMASLFLVMLMANVPTLALQAGVARGMARRLQDEGEDGAGAVLRQALGMVVRWQIIVLGLALLAAVPLVEVFHVRHAVPPVATGVAIGVGILIPVALGGMQAHERFGAFSFVQFLYAGLKFPVCLGLVVLGFGVSGIMVGVALATVVTAVVALLLQRDTLRAARHSSRAEPTALLRDSGSAAVALTLWTIAAYADVLASRLALHDHHLSGLYAGASMAAKLIFVAPSVAMTVLFPRIARLKAGRMSEREHLVLGIRFVALFAGIGTALAFVVPHQLLELGLGEKYTGAAPWLGWIALAMSLFALVNVYVVHFVALGKTRFPLVLAAGVVAELAAFVAFHASIHELLVVQLVAAGVLVVCAELYDRLRAA